MSAGVQQEVVDVDNDVGQPGDDGLHEALETCRGTKKAHWGCNLLELAHARDREGRVLPAVGLEQHLPKS